jgi:hypothetical protein
MAPPAWAFSKPSSAESDFAAVARYLDMPVNPNNYNHRGGGNYGIVVRLPQIVTADRLVYFDYNRTRGSWVIRDFIAGQRLDDENSILTVPQIEADATHDEFPPWRNAEVDPADWRAYLTLRSTAAFRLNAPLCPAAPPNPRSGTWQSL